MVSRHFGKEKIEINRIYATPKEWLDGYYSEFEKGVISRHEDAIVILKDRYRDHCGAHDIVPDIEGLMKELKG